MTSDIFMVDAQQMNFLPENTLHNCSQKSILLK